jgi:hypothetical protein
MVVFFDLECPDPFLVARPLPDVSFPAVILQRNAFFKDNR